MIAIEIREPGEPDVLVPVERPTPTARSGEVLIKVAAAGVNRPDVMQRRGKYPPPPGASDIPGLEVAGTIDQIGPDVTGWKIGDAVCALVAGGGYAEYCAAPSPQCLPAPRGLDLVSAAAIPETFFTVWTNVFERGRLDTGESILIHGGSSGIGTTAIQLARARGARVFTTAGSAEKCRACEQLGAERAINYKEADFLDAVRVSTGGRGVDVVLDCSAGAGTMPVLLGIEALKRKGGTMVVQGEMAEFPNFPIGRMTVKFVTLKSARGHSYRACELALAQLASKRFPLEKITTHTFGLKDVDLAIRSVGGQGVPDVIHASLMPWK